MIAVQDCTPAGITGLVVPLLMLALLGRAALLLIRRRYVGLGDRGLLTATRGGFAGTASAALIFGGLSSLAVARGVYLAGNPGGPSPEPAFMAMSVAMIGLVAFLAWPLIRERHYTLRGSWYLLGGLAAFLAFFALVDMPCGSVAAAWVFYGIDVAMAGCVLRIGTLLGE